LTKTTADYKDELAMNTHLKKDHEKWQALVSKLESQHETYVKEKTGEIADLKEQLRDVMFYIEGQRMIEESPLKDELSEGQVSVPPKASTSKKRGGGKR
jgi:BRCA1-associated protein